jgi:O-antigen/teichoic acid export membrane protein
MSVNSPSPIETETDLVIRERSKVTREQPRLTGRLVAGNVLWNILGNAAPIVVAIGSIPVLERTLGADRFGLLALSWTFIGYFGIFDLGLGLAMTRSVATKLASGDHDTIHATVWTTLAIMASLGCLGLGVAWTLAPVIIHTLRIPSGLQAEALRTVQLLAFSIPLVITSVGLRGILEAHLKFKLVNLAGIPLGVWTYIGPIIALPFTHSLVVIVGLLVIGRVAGFLLYLGLALKAVPTMRAVVFQFRLVRPLLSYGGWLTVDNLVDPITNFLDRFLIGFLVAIAAVTYYSIPYELAAKAWLLPVALSGVLFPALTRSLVHDRAQARFFFDRACKYLLMAMFPIILAMVCLAQPGLSFWIGPQVATRSTAVLQILAIGVLITSLGSLADTFIDSYGRPDVSAKLALGKMVVHFGPAFWVIGHWGIVGLAALWVTSTGLEAAGMMLFALRFQGRTASSLVRGVLKTTPVWILLAGAALLPLNIELKAAYVVLVVSGSAGFAWRRLMSPEERGSIRARLGRPARSPDDRDAAASSRS